MFSMPYNRVQIIDLLSSRGITPTQQRVEIAQIMFTKDQHLSAEQVLEQVNGEKALVSKATVYNTLGLFAAKGLLREVIVDPNKVFYDTNVRPHHHFYNMDDSTLVDIDVNLVQIHQLPIPPEGLITDGVEVVIRVRREAML